MRGADIVVAGAGAVGRVAALRLARAGHRVTVVDPMQASASSVAAGMLAPAFEAVFDAPAAGDFTLLRGARDLWPSLAAEIGLPLSRDGALAVGAREAAEGWAARLAAICADAALLAPAEVAAAAPGLAAGTWAAFTPEDWRLEPASALDRLQAAAETCGVQFLKARVLGFEGGRVTLDNGERLATDRLVIATGADRGLAALAPELEVLTPIKGHILRTEGPTRAAPVVRTGDAYLCRGDGEAVLGSTMEVGVADADVEPSVVARLVKAAGLLEGLVAHGPRPIGWRAAAGVRASTPDGLPLAGPAGAAGVILAVGARRNGWLLAPLIAEAVLAAVEGRAAEGAAARFGPGRIAG
jgi:glycine oxidase